MSELEPSVAADLAASIYDVQETRYVERFLDLPYFKSSSGSGASPHVHLTAEVGGRVLLNHKDGFGVCAQGGEGYENEVFLIFRGTTGANMGADILTDARMGISISPTGLPVHSGFDHCFVSMLPDIKRFFDTLGGHVTLVHCVGHSLGGAIATLAAEWVARTRKYPTKLYTFGSPRVGTNLFAKSVTSALISKNIHRVHHRTDPVSMVPLYPFMHIPSMEVGHYLPCTYTLLSADGHRMPNYITSVSGKAWDTLKDMPEEPYTIAASIEAWLESKSPVDTSSAAFWRWIESSLIYVIKKIAEGATTAASAALSVAGITLQAAFISAFTIADKMAYILAEGIDLSKNISIWVVHLMRKLMQALGMAVAKTSKELTHSLITYVLTRLSAKATREAINALRQI